MYVDLQLRILSNLIFLFVGKLVGRGFVLDGIRQQEKAPVLGLHQARRPQDGGQPGLRSAAPGVLLRFSGKFSVAIDSY